MNTMTDEQVRWCREVGRQSLVTHPPTERELQATSTIAAAGLARLARAELASA